MTPKQTEGIPGPGPEEARSGGPPCVCGPRLHPRVAPLELEHPARASRSGPYVSSLEEPWGRGLPLTDEETVGSGR